MDWIGLKCVRALLINEMTIWPSYLNIKYMLESQYILIPRIPMCIFKVIALLLRYNSHIIKYNSVIFSIFRVLHPSPLSNPGAFHHITSQRNPMPVSGHSPFLFPLKPLETTDLLPVCGFVYFGHSIEIESCNIWPFISGFFHLA